MAMHQVFLGLDVGSVSTNGALVADDGSVAAVSYLRTRGQPIPAIQQTLHEMAAALPPGCAVAGLGSTGSARHLAAVIAGADVVKNEITAHAIAASHVLPGVHTVIEIGGQDSKLIVLREGVVVDFAMNTVCAAGTGSFLDQQAFRLGIPIEQFGDYAVRSGHPCRIAGRCTVFAESDMIHRQQMGHTPEDIIAGLCEALVRNYLNNVARGKEIRPPVVFQGGVAANIGIRQAFERALQLEVTVPEYHGVMGAIGAALLAQSKSRRNGAGTAFRGFGTAAVSFRSSSRDCSSCSNACEIIEIAQAGNVLARWGDKCGKYQL